MILSNSRDYDLQQVEFVEKAKVKTLELYLQYRLHSLLVIDWIRVEKQGVKVAQSCPTLCNPMDYPVHGILQARRLEWVAYPFPRDHPKPRIELRSPTLQGDSLPAEPQGKPKMLEWVFPADYLIQESNQGLLHYRRILYQLSCQASLRSKEMRSKRLKIFRSC